MRSLPFPRRLQLVKLLRAHGLRDVERLREDELKAALARLSILMPDLAQETPYVTAPSSQMGQMGGASTDVPDLSDDEDRYMVPRFREPKPFLPNGERTFVRVIAVKPRRLFATWDLRWDLPDGAIRLEVVLAPTLGESPTPAQLSTMAASFTVDVDRHAPGWYIDVPADRFAVVIRVVVDAADGPVTVATSNVALTPPARPAPPGPLWLATLTPDVDRRALRGAGLLKPSLPDGATLNTQGDALPDAVMPTGAIVADPPSSSFRFLGHTELESPSSSSMASRSSSSTLASPPSSPSSSPSLSTAAAGRAGARP